MKYVSFAALLICAIIAACLLLASHTLVVDNPHLKNWCNYPGALTNVDVNNTNICTYNNTKGEYDFNRTAFEEWQFKEKFGFDRTPDISEDPHVTCDMMVKINLYPPDENVSIRINNKTYVTDVNGSIVTSMCVTKLYTIQTDNFTTKLYPHDTEYTIDTEGW